MPTKTVDVREVQISLQEEYTLQSSGQATILMNLFVYSGNGVMWCTLLNARENPLRGASSQS